MNATLIVFFAFLFVLCVALTSNNDQHPPMI